MSNINYEGVIRHFFETHVKEVTDGMKVATKNAVMEGATETKRNVATRGISKPGRIETGAMYDSANSKVVSESQDEITAAFGFMNTPYYTVYQEDGTSQVKAMYALRDAAEHAKEQLMRDLRGLL